MTLQGTPPGAAQDIYTMFAGSFPERIGNACDPDDVDVILKGITILDPRWRRTNDPVKNLLFSLPSVMPKAKTLDYSFLPIKMMALTPKRTTHFMPQA